jgi:hypothetical protein
LQKSAILHWKDDLLFFTSGDFIHLLRQVKVATMGED